MFSDYNVIRLETIKGKQQKQNKSPKQLEIKQRISK